MSQSPLSSLQAKIAARIVEHVRQQGLQPGHHLTEQALAKEFGVSRSPIRAALLYLSEKGVLRAVTNQGYFLSQSADQLDQQDLGIPETEEDQLYWSITADRVRNELPEQMSEADLMRRYDVGRGLLSRALLRLSQEGIVQRSDGYGWIFTPTLNSEQAHDESYRFRLLLEPAGLLEPTFKLNKERLARCRAAHLHLVETAKQERSSAEMFAVNADFHLMLAEFSGNRFIHQAIEQQNRLRRLLEYRGFHDPERIRASCAEHLAIMDALESGDNRWASTLLHRHLDVASQLKLAFGRTEEAGAISRPARAANSR